jgi:hypothetical protein
VFISLAEVQQSAWREKDFRNFATVWSIFGQARVEEIRAVFATGKNV